MRFNLIYALGRHWVAQSTVRFTMRFNLIVAASLHTRTRMVPYWCHPAVTRVGSVLHSQARIAAPSGDLRAPNFSHRYPAVTRMTMVPATEAMLDLCRFDPSAHACTCYLYEHRCTNIAFPVHTCSCSRMVNDES